MFVVDKPLLAQDTTTRCFFVSRLLEVNHSFISVLADVHVRLCAVCFEEVVHFERKNIDMSF